MTRRDSPSTDDSADPVRLRLRALSVLLATLGLAGCRWSDASAPGSRVSPEVVDAELDGLIDELESPTENTNQNAVRFRVQQIAHQHREHVRAQWVAAVLSQAAGDSTRVQIHLDRILQRRPAHDGARALAARSAIGDGDLGRARRLIDDGLVLRPASVVLHEVDGLCAMLEGRPDASIEAIQRAEELGAPAARTAYHRGLLAERSGSPREAHEWFEVALRSDPNLGLARERLRALELRREPETESR